MKQFIARNNKGLKSLGLIITAIYTYVFLEWIFYVTKPSFMSNMNTAQKAQVFFLTAFILILPALLAGVFVIGAKMLLGKIFKSMNFTWLYAILPALIFAALELILIDNFTYTVFNFGVVTTDGLWRIAYAVLFIVLFILSFRPLIKYIRSPKSMPSSVVYLLLFLLVISSFTLISKRQIASLGERLGVTQSSTQMPNIILLGIDGVSAKNMSAYGYTRDTTPNIKAFAQNALVAENAFSNAANTGGSLASLLTGKLPSETRVLYPPDILLGEDPYQHLPGILKQMGYQTVQVTMASYADAYERNIKGGFDIANFRAESETPLLRIFSSLGGGNGVYFSTLILERVTDRLGHAFLIKKMENAFETVTKPTSTISEKERFNAMLSYLDEADRPIFLHVQMFGPHGPRFHPRKRVFSIGEEQTKNFMVDFYDDAILDFDRYFNILFKHLDKTGKLDNTIVILYSDHGMDWDPLQRIPLMIWFPNNQHVGKIGENVQLIDVAPTILDYLEVPQPAWMPGQSIVANNLSPARSIFSMNVAEDLVGPVEGQGWVVHEDMVAPPFYQLGIVNLVVCDQWFSLNLRTPELIYGKVSGSSAACNKNDIPSPEQAKQMILQRLTDDHYDVSSLPDDIPIIPFSTETEK